MAKKAKSSIKTKLPLRGKALEKQIENLCRMRNRCKRITDLTLALQRELRLHEAELQWSTQSPMKNRFNEPDHIDDAQEAPALTILNEEFLAWRWEDLPGYLERINGKAK